MRLIPFQKADKVSRKQRGARARSSRLEPDQTLAGSPGPVWHPNASSAEACGGGPLEQRRAADHVGGLVEHRAAWFGGVAAAAPIEGASMAQAASCVPQHLAYQQQQKAANLAGYFGAAPTDALTKAAAAAAAAAAATSREQMFGFPSAYGANPLLSAQFALHLVETLKRSHQQHQQPAMAMPPIEQPPSFFSALYPNSNGTHEQQQQHHQPLAGERLAPSTRPTPMMRQTSGACLMSSPFVASASYVRQAGAGGGLGEPRSLVGDLLGSAAARLAGSMGCLQASKAGAGCPSLGPNLVVRAKSASSSSTCSSPAASGAAIR